ncbi:ATP-binding cassette domain-containing protein [Corynebacterium uterequi]|uniref:ATPase component of ABC-type transport system, contains duplicated ATPase domain protein n=1 Tax=Corynebacterium uterequi TaxID=1072256 RepID=A0A0G3HKI1_9CORY|nr:ABC transporter ATP-binding protein [Corynebacterium uterequi]AKK11607.1 ATPase component of ABC-type transport system, contains duplicated ATPase domain protein [Corynebacterium uterequi]
MLSITDLTIDGLLHGVSLDIAPGGRLGLIGESGSGKSLTALSVMGLLPAGLTPRGSITFDGQELIGLPDRAHRRLRGPRIAMVFQEPMTALDPMMTIGAQLAEALAGPGGHRRRAHARVAQLLADVQLDAALARSYPHELSGGQRQRVLIAMAISRDPDLLICDEPTTALDVFVQDQILTLLEDLVAARGMALLFVTHDLGVIARMCEEVAVMSSGEVVERGGVAEILHTPTHPYTRQLVAASRPGPPASQRPVGEEIIRVEDATWRPALNAVSLTVRRGERLGIVGGSGSGKSTLLGLIAGLRTPDSGTVSVSGRVHMVFQDPQSSLDPRMPVATSVAEACRGDRARAEEALAEVGIAGERHGDLPHQFSGGQRQRISIARANAPRPDILLADEPVSALDVSVRAQVLDALNRLVDDHGLTLVFVSHDLSVVRQVCTTVAVVHDGEIVEHGPTEQVWQRPQHPYTQALLAAVPSV